MRLTTPDPAEQAPLVARSVTPPSPLARGGTTLLWQRAPRSCTVFVMTPPNEHTSEGGRDDRRGPVPCGIDPIQCSSAQAHTQKCRLTSISIHFSAKTRSTVHACPPGPANCWPEDLGRAASPRGTVTEAEMRLFINSLKARDGPLRNAAPPRYQSTSALASSRHRHDRAAAESSTACRSWDYGCAGRACRATENDDWAR